MKIEVKKIALENYKCFEEKMVDFSYRTKVSGRNREGKSTIQDAYYDVLTGKMSDGTNLDRIRPHDENGVNIDKVDCIREVYLEIDGKPVTIKKRTFQKWKKPRGKMKEVFDGNGVDYEVDGFPHKPEKFKEYISGIVNPDTLLLCGNANYFLNTLQSSTTEARKILEKLSGFSAEQFIAENPKYEHISEITKGHSVEDTIKKLKKQLTEQKKKIEAQNTKIKYEKTRNSDKPDIGLSNLELMKLEWKEKIATIDKKESELDGLSKSYDDLSKKIRELKKIRDLLSSEANSENIQKKSSLDWQIAELNRKKKILSDELRQNEMDLRQVIMEIQRHAATLEQARTDYAEWSSRQFDESKLHAIEIEEFNENSLLCPTCGQALPKDKQSEMREKFQKSKNQRIADQETERKAFDESLDLRLESIALTGNTAKQNLKSSEQRKIDIEKKIEQIKQDLSSASLDIEKMTTEYIRVPDSVDLSENPEYMEIQKQISDKEAELSSLDNGSDKRRRIREERNSCIDEISKIEAKIQKMNADKEEKERNISILESDLREMSQTAADLEKQIDMISKFSRAKNTALATTINPHFRHFQFSFLEFTIEGNPVETCKMMCGGTDYMKGLNGGDRKLCEIDLCRGLQELNNLCLPIWIDEANTIDPWRIPKDLEQQLILINRDDGDLKVEGMT